MEIIEVPGNIDFVLASKIDRILYDQMDMTDVFGLLRIKDKQIDMQGLRMDMLEGSMEVNGSYNTIDKNKPGMDFDIKINDFDIPSSYETFGMMKKMAPIMKNCNGSFSAQFDLVSGLDQKMEPIYSSMNGGGGVQSNEVVVKGSPTIEKLSAVLKNDKYKELNLKNLDVTFQFKEGRLFVDPFETQLGNSTATISGSNGFDLSLDYLIEMEVPTSEFGSGVSSAIGQVTSLLNNSGANVSVGDALNVGIVIGGTTDDPVVTLGKISPVGGEASVKEQVADEIDKKIDEAKEQAKEEIDKAKADAEKQLKEQAEKIISEAEKQAAKLIEEAKKLAGVTKKEGYDNAQKLEDEASNPLQKMAAKAAADQLRKEADKQAKKIIDAAANKAKTLVDNARKKAGGPK
jgi:vacuolar-type H+-ATPase subunit H